MAKSKAKNDEVIDLDENQTDGNDVENPVSDESASELIDGYGAESPIEHLTIKFLCEVGRAYKNNSTAELFYALEEMHKEYLEQDGESDADREFAHNHLRTIQDVEARQIR